MCPRVCIIQIHSVDNLMKVNAIYFIDFTLYAGISKRTQELKHKNRSICTMKLQK